MKSSDRVLIFIAGFALAATMTATVAVLAFSGRLSLSIGDLLENRAVSLKTPAYALSLSPLDDDQTRAAISEGDWERAITLLEPLLARSHDNADLRKAYGIALFNSAIALVEESDDEADLDRAAERLERSAAFLSSEPDHNVNVTRATASIGLKHYEGGRRDKGRAKIEQSRARLSNDPYVCYLLGAIMAREGYLAKAHPLLVVGTMSTEENIRAAASDLLADIDADVKSEANFSVSEHARFIVRYEGPPRPEIAAAIIGILESESPKIANLVGRTPNRKTEVIVYTQSEFATARGLADWVGGLFDGRIRVGYGDAMSGDASLRKILRHEYSHASVFDILGRPAPAWLDEGIAQIVEKGDNPSPAELRRLVALANVPLANLNDPFTKMNRDQAGAAYALSYAATIHIMRRTGPGAFPAILARLNSGENIDAALQYVLGTGIAELDAQTRTWLES